MHLGTKRSIKWTRSVCRKFHVMGEKNGASDHKSLTELFPLPGNMSGGNASTRLNGGGRRSVEVMTVNNPAAL